MKIKSENKKNEALLSLYRLYQINHYVQLLIESTYQNLLGIGKTCQQGRWYIVVVCQQSRHHHGDHNHNNVQCHANGRTPAWDKNKVKKDLMSEHDLIKSRTGEFHNIVIQEIFIKWKWKHLVANIRMMLGKKVSSIKNWF